MHGDGVRLPAPREERRQVKGAWRRPHHQSRMLVMSNAATDGKRLATELKSAFCCIQEKIYPDGEKIYSIKGTSQKIADVILFKFNKQVTFDDQLYNLASLLYRFADRRTTRLVLPYLPYLRSYPCPKQEVDKLALIFRAITERVKKLYLVSPHVDARLIAVHLPPGCITVVDVDRSIISYLASLKNALMLVAPDGGSLREVKRLSAKSGWDYVAITKVRLSPLAVSMKLGKIAIRKIAANDDKTFVIIDDMVSTGGTLVRASALLRSYGVKKIFCVVTHDTSKGVRKKRIDVRCSNSLVNVSSRGFDLTDSIRAALVADWIK